MSQSKSRVKMNDGHNNNNNNNNNKKYAPRTMITFTITFLVLLLSSTTTNFSLFLFAEAKHKLNIKSSGVDMVHASHILTGQNRTLAEDIIEMLEPYQEDAQKRPTLERGFEELARKFSRCPTGKRNGGDLGYFPRGEMTREFDSVVFSELAAPLHRVVGPHQTSNGYHVIIVHDRHLATAEMREDAKKATEEAKEKRENSFKKNMQREQGKQDRKKQRVVNKPNTNNNNNNNNNRVPHNSIKHEEF